MTAYPLGYKHLYLLTDLPAPGVSDGDVDDVAAAVLAAYALQKNDVSGVTLVFCNDGSNRRTQFRRCANLDGELDSTKIQEYGELFKLYKALGNLTESNKNFKFQSEKDFNNTPPPSPSESLIIIISPITKDTVLTLNTCKENGARLTFQGNNIDMDYNLKETIKKINAGAASEEALIKSETTRGVYEKLIGEVGLSSLTSKKKFPMNNIENNKVGTSLKKMFIGKKIGMSYALNDFVIENLDNFFKPGGEADGVAQSWAVVAAEAAAATATTDEDIVKTQAAVAAAKTSSQLRPTYDQLLNTVKSAAEASKALPVESVDPDFGVQVEEVPDEDKSKAKGNSLKPFLETLSKFTNNEQKLIINEINRITIHDEVVAVLDLWRGGTKRGRTDQWGEGLKMFKFVIKFGIYVYGDKFIGTLFPGKEGNGVNSWIDVMVAQPTPVGGGAEKAIKLHDRFLEYTPDMWDLYAVAHVLYPKEEVNSDDDILNQKIIEKLNKGLKLLQLVEDAPSPALTAAPIGGYKKTRKLKKHRTRKGHNRKRPTRKRNKSQKKRIRKTHHKRKLYKRR